jgi:hypothetical protein
MKQMEQHVIVSSCTEIDVHCDGSNTDTEIIIVPQDEKYFFATQDTAQTFELTSESELFVTQ